MGLEMDGVRSHGGRDLEVKAPRDVCRFKGWCADVL